MPVNPATGNVVEGGITEQTEQVMKNLDAILKGERGTAWIQYAIDAAKKFANDKVSVDLKATDFAEIVDEGYDYEITVPNGFSADVEFKLADDKNADVFDAIEMAYGDQWAAEGYELVSVTSHKEVTLNAETDRLVDSEKLFYDVVRIIDEVLLKKVEETTTTTEETTTEETTTTTEESTTEETTTTTEESSEEETTTTTEESTTEESTTTTEEISEISEEETTTTTEESTTSAPIETTSTEPTTDSEPVETTTTTEGTDVYGEEGLYELAFNAEGVADELVYWSEETTEFDFDNLSVKMVLSITSEDGSSTSKDIDVTAAFEPKQKSPQDFDFVGFANYNIQIALTDVGAIRSALEAEIEDAKKDEVIEKLLKTYKLEEGRLADTKGQIPVILAVPGSLFLHKTILHALQIIGERNHIIHLFLDQWKSS